jgi:hypothetical protein
MSEEANTENLPAVVVDHDGFDDTGADDRLIQGVIIRCVDGVWSAKDDTPISKETRLIVLNTAEALQRWENGRPVETIVKEPGKRLPDVDELNAKIPKKRWEKGLDGQPRPPWVKQSIAYLLDPKDASVFTFINGTVGAAIAIGRLKDKVKMMRALRGERVVPVVELSSTPMKTQFGMKQRPNFAIHEWRNLGGPQGVGGGGPAINSGGGSAIEHVSEPVKPVSTEEVLNDSIGF